MTELGRWPQGSDEIEELLAAGELETVEPSRTHAQTLLQQAGRHLESAALLVDTDPSSAYALLYDGARKALTAVLAVQGLRPTRQGGHVAVQQAVEAQLGPNTRHFVRSFRTLRRRRHESEYPSPDVPEVDDEEARDGLASAREIRDVAERLLPLLGRFSPGS